MIYGIFIRENEYNRHESTYVFHGLFSFFICNNYYKKYIKDSYNLKKNFKCARVNVAMVTTSNFHISQTFSCISKFFLQFILYFIGLNCHYVYI